MSFSSIIRLNHSKSINIIKTSQLRGRGRHIFESEASLVYILSSRTARLQRETLSQNKTRATTNSPSVAAETQFPVKQLCVLILSFFISFLPPPLPEPLSPTPSLWCQIQAHKCWANADTELPRLAHLDTQAYMDSKSLVLLASSRPVLPLQRQHPKVHRSLGQETMRTPYSAFRTTENFLSPSHL